MLIFLRDNFVIIYELLDEMMDNGYPQITEVKILLLSTEIYNERSGQDSSRIHKE